jgi:tetratricopeptide (TPR) repeat protein
MVGRPRRAIAMLEQALELSRQHHLTLQQAIQTDNLGLAYDSLGDYQLAQRYHREALALLDSTDEPHWWAVFNTNLAATLLSLGLLDEAEACLDAVAALRSREDAPPNLQAQLLRARLHLLRGRPADADDLLVETMTLARRGEQKRLLAEALSLRSEQQALLQQVEAARAAWTEAQRLYGILRMPQAKHQPVWLHDDHPQES